MKRNFLVILMVIIALMACKTDSDSDPECNCPVKEHLALGENCTCGLANCGCTLKPTCECPNGTLHLIGETCCERNNCTCEKNVPEQRVNGIAVTNRYGVTVSDFTTMVGEVTTALNYYSGVKENFIKTNLKEIKIIQGPADVIIAPINGILEIKNGCTEVDIDGVLDLWCFNNGITLMYDKKSNIIYLAKDKLIQYVRQG